MELAGSRPREVLRGHMGPFVIVIASVRDCVEPYCVLDECIKEK